LRKFLLTAQDHSGDLLDLLDEGSKAGGYAFENSRHNNPLDPGKCGKLRCPLCVICLDAQSPLTNAGALWLWPPQLAAGRRWPNWTKAFEIVLCFSVHIGTVDAYCGMDDNTKYAIAIAGTLLSVAVVFVTFFVTLM
jgi:hypothetical protein